jgi:TonB family protein
VLQQTEELELVKHWQVPGEERRVLSAGVLSILAHVVFFLVLISLPKEAFVKPPSPRPHQVFTPLVAPPKELTQTAPNKGTVGHEFNLENLMPRPAIQPRVSPPSSTQPAARIQAPPAPSVASVARPSVPTQPIPFQPPPPLPDGADKIAQAPALGTVPAAPPPPPAATEKPKLAFEKPGTDMGSPTGTGTGGIVRRPQNAAEVMRAANPSMSHGGVVVGDMGEGIGGIGSSLSLPPSPPKMGSNLELLSDPMGVDFRPYLVQVLAAVRRNWMAVIPESARYGQHGKVVIQFALRRDGRVAKLVLAMDAGPGAQALDRAAVASISASDPFPPLPPEFHGDTVRLQLAFLYNQTVR